VFAAVERARDEPTSGTAESEIKSSLVHPPDLNYSPLLRNIDPNFFKHRRLSHPNDREATSQFTAGATLKLNQQ
jgi:hypothetical protein